MNSKSSIVALYLFSKKGGELHILCSLRGETAPTCPNMYNVPCGHCNEGESLEHAVIRELYEETNIVLSEEAIVRLPSNYVVNYGAFLLNNPEPTNGDNENCNTCWVPVKEAIKMPFMGSQARKIKQFTEFIV